MTSTSAVIRAEVQALTWEYDARLMAWNTSGNAQLLGRFVDRDLNSFRTTQITRCVCLGLGRLSSRRAMEELVLLTEVLTCLDNTHAITEVFFQDPAFTEADISFLESLGFSATADPNEAFQYLTPTTLLYNPFTTNTVIAMAFDFCPSPAVYLGPELATVRGYGQGAGSAPCPLTQIAEQRRALAFRTLMEYETEAQEERMPVFNGYEWATRDMRFHWML